MIEMICIVCPKGCRLRVDEENDCAVTGNLCKRGAEYGQKELKNPTRAVSSTVALKGSFLERLPVKTDGFIPKRLVLDAVRLLDSIEAQAPVRVGDVVLENIMGTGVSFVATRSL